MTRQISYQVLDQYGRPFFGNGNRLDVSETVTTVYGPKITGGGHWMQSNHTMDPYGVFTDYLSYAGGNSVSVAGQIFTANFNGLPINLHVVNFNSTLLVNQYSKSGVTVNGTTSPRPCGDKDVRLN
jgi:hypothetical protein